MTDHQSLWWEAHWSQVYTWKWNESGFRPPLCTYRLNWARRTSWGWWDDWDDTVLQTQDSKFEPWRSEAEHATSRSRRLPTILTFTRGWGRNNFVSFKPPRPGTEPRTLAWKAAVLTTTLGPPPCIHGVWRWPTLRASLLLTMQRRKAVAAYWKKQPVTAVCHCRPAWQSGAMELSTETIFSPSDKKYPGSRHGGLDGGPMLGHRLRRWPSIGQPSSVPVAPPAVVAIHNIDTGITDPVEYKHTTPCFLLSSKDPATFLTESTFILLLQRFSPWNFFQRFPRNLRYHKITYLRSKYCYYFRIIRWIKFKMKKKRYFFYLVRYAL